MCILSAVSNLDVFAPISSVSDDCMDLTCSKSSTGSTATIGFVLKLLHRHKDDQLDSGICCS